MALFLLCCFMGLLFQGYAFVLWREKPLLVRLLPILFLELFPLGGIVYYAVTRPSGFLFDWKDNIAFCLWIALAFLLGGALAWGLHRLRRNGK